MNDVVEIGPECFASADGSVLSWKGENYYPASVGDVEAIQQEYADAQPTPGTDEKGRILVECLSDRELLKEAVGTLRLLTDILEAAGQSPMAAAMMPGLARLGK